MVPLELANGIYGMDGHEGDANDGGDSNATNDGKNGEDGGAGNQTDDDGTELLVNDIVLNFKGIHSKKDMEELKGTITAAFELQGIPVRLIEKDENYARQFLRDDIEGGEEFMAMFPIIIFMVSAFGLVMSLRRMTQTLRPQIGIFKALGVPERHVFFFFIFIATVIALCGTLLGWLLAIPMNLFFKGIEENIMDLAVSDYRIAWKYYIISGVLAFILSLACTLIPARAAMRMKPIDAIQKREGMTRKGVSGIAGSIGRKRELSVPVKLTLRNLLRRPGRTSSTVLGVALSLSLFLSMVIVLESILVVLDTSEVNRWDYEVGLEGFQPENISEPWVMGIGGPQDHSLEVNNGLLLPSTLTREGDEHDEREAIIFALDDLEESYKMEYDDGGIREGGIVISFWHADKLDLSVGDDVVVEVPFFDPMTGFRTDNVSLEVTGIQSNHIGYYAFMELGTLQNVTNLTGMVNLVYLRSNGDGSGDPSSAGDQDRVLENTIRTTPGVSSLTHSSERENFMDQFFDIILQFMYMIAFMSTALAGAIVYTLFKINAQEKRREYATMKTLGTSIPKIAKLIYLEAAVITIFGIILGAIGGYLLAAYLILSSEQMEVINIPILFSWLGFGIGTILIVLVVILVSWVTIRYIAGINIANVIRERSTG